MRTLKFIVNKQIITEDPNCNFDNIVPGTAGYLKAEFSFSDEWDKAIKVVAFYRNGNECPPQILEDGKSCMIPAEALKGRKFAIKLLGKNKDIKLTTNKIEVTQNGG